MIPWFERPIIYDVRARPNLVESTSGSRDLQMVNMHISFSPMVPTYYSSVFLSMHYQVHLKFGPTNLFHPWLVHMCLKWLHWLLWLCQQKWVLFNLYSIYLFVNSWESSIIASLLQKMSMVNLNSEDYLAVCLTTISCCHLGRFNQILIKHFSFACSSTYIYSSYFLCLRRKR